MKIKLFVIGLAVLLGACVGSPYAEENSEPITVATTAAEPVFTMGNGEKNWITVADVARDENTFTFSTANIEDDGWLVLHPFKDGKPNGKIYVGASYIEKGSTSSIEVSVEELPKTGTPFLVMLHLDSNNNGVFDFVFVDERNVVDRAVFEGSKMIAHVFQSP